MAYFLAEVEGVAGFQADELVRVGRVSLRRLVKPLAVEPRGLLHPVLAEDVYRRGTDVPLAVAPANLELVPILSF